MWHVGFNFDFFKQNWKLEFWDGRVNSGFYIWEQILFKVFIFKREGTRVCMWGRGREWGSEREESQADSALSAQSLTWGSIPQTERSWPELKSRVRHSTDWATQVLRRTKKNFFNQIMSILFKLNKWFKWHLFLTSSWPKVENSWGRVEKGHISRVPPFSSVCPCTAERAPWGLPSLKSQESN